MPHHISLHRFHAQRNGGQAVGDEVDPQKLHGQKRRLVPQEHGGKYGDNLADVRAQQELSLIHIS